MDEIKRDTAGRGTHMYLLKLYRTTVEFLSPSLVHTRAVAAR